MRHGARVGLTLIELLLALVVLCVGVLGVLAALPSLASTSGRVESLVEASDAAHRVAETLRAAARRHTRVVWDTSPTGARTPRSVYLLLPGADGAVPALPEPAVFGDRRCLVLPFGTDEVFTYPRGGDAATIAAKNGGGDPARAQAGLEPEGVYPLDPSVGDDARGTSFALRFQRARLADGPRDGLYRVEVLVFRGQEQGDGPPSGRLLATLATELAAGPHGGLLIDASSAGPGGAGGAPDDPGTVVDPRDWVQAIQAKRRKRLHPRAGGRGR